jgi:hypothetical protein
VRSSNSVTFHPDVGDSSRGQLQPQQQQQPLRQLGSGGGPHDGSSDHGQTKAAGSLAGLQPRPFVPSPPPHALYDAYAQRLADPRERDFFRRTWAGAAPYDGSPLAPHHGGAHSPLPGMPSSAAAGGYAYPPYFPGGHGAHDGYFPAGGGYYGSPQGYPVYYGGDGYAPPHVLPPPYYGRAGGPQPRPQLRHALEFHEAQVAQLQHAAAAEQFVAWQAAQQPRWPAAAAGGDHVAHAPSAVPAGGQAALTLAQRASPAAPQRQGEHVPPMPAARLPPATLSGAGAGAAAAAGEADAAVSPAVGTPRATQPQQLPYGEFLRPFQPSSPDGSSRSRTASVAARSSGAESTEWWYGGRRNGSSVGGSGSGSSTGEAAAAHGGGRHTHLTHAGEGGIRRDDPPREASAERPAALAPEQAATPTQQQHPQPCQPLPPSRKAGMQAGDADDAVPVLRADDAGKQPPSPDGGSEDPEAGRAV